MDHHYGGGGGEEEEVLAGSMDHHYGGGGEEEEVLAPVSPTGQYLKSSLMSLTILAVLELDVPIDDSETLSLLRDVFLPINPRFSAIMVGEKNGKMKWKQVHVNLQDHVHIPTFPTEKSPEFYDQCLTNYLSHLYLDPLPETQPLWQLHIIKYPTTTAKGTIIFKLHHALGDGYSLMGALLSCLQRVDNPSLPLTFPTRPQFKAAVKSKRGGSGCRVLKRVSRVVSGVLNTVLDFVSSVSVSCFVKDDRTPIRSGNFGVEFRPKDISIITLPLEHIKQIKTKLNVTTNDVITGLILLGTRLYMEGESYGSRKARSTAMVLLNTRYAEGYNSISEMVKPGTKTPWGNYIAFLHVSIPKLIATDSSNPLHFVQKAHRIIKRKRNSFAVYLVGRLLENLRKLRGPEVAAKYLYSTMQNTSLGISSLIGPAEQMALADHPVSGLYYLVAGPPQSLQLTVMNYLGKLRIGLVVEKDFIDQQKFKSSIEKAYEMIFKAAMG